MFAGVSCSSVIYCKLVACVYAKSEERYSTHPWILRMGQLNLYMMKVLKRGYACDCKRARTHTRALLQCLFQSHLLHLPEPKLAIRDIIMVVKLGVVSVRLHVVLFSVLVGRVTDA